MSIDTDFLSDIIEQVEAHKQQAEKALSQIDDEQFFRSDGSESNSIAVIIKHMAGNYHSRWRDFLTTDGEKADRKRDSEFEISENDSRSSLMQRWDAGWKLYLVTMRSLSAEQLGQTVTIRGETLSVLSAINRAALHTAFHVGQIVLLAKSHCGSSWKSLSIPRGESDKYRKQ